MILNYNILKSMEELFGESFYLLDSDVFSRNYDEFLSEFKKYYPKTNIGYSYKTNYIPKLCEIVDKKGGYAEVVSTMEYDLAIKVGVDPKNILVNGPYKNKKALEKFLLNGSNVNIDSYREARLLLEIAASNPQNILNIGLRCNFEIDDLLISRFGFDVESSSFYRLFNELQNIDNIAINGIHCHFPNRNLESYVDRTNKMLKLSDMLFDTPPKYIDIGGGYFGRLEESLRKQFLVRVPDYKEYAEIIGKRFYDHYSHLNYQDRPMLLLEPGTALVGDSMKFIAKVVDVKDVRGSYIATISGSKFNIGLLSSSLNMPISVYNKKNKSFCYNSIDIAGFTCIEGDYLYKGYFGGIEVDDFVSFENVGSYSIVFKPQFILPNVPIVEYNHKDNCFEIIKRQETFEDVFLTFNI